MPFGVLPFPALWLGNILAYSFIVFFFSLSPLSVLRLLAARDYNIVVGGYQICEDLMKKLPAIFRIYFQREGVVHELRRISKLSTVATPAAAAVVTPASSSSPVAQSPTTSSPSTPSQPPTRRLTELMRKLKEKASGEHPQEPVAPPVQAEPAAPVTPKHGRSSQGFCCFFVYSALLLKLGWIDSQRGFARLGDSAIPKTL